MPNYTGRWSREVAAGTEAMRGAAGSQGGSRSTLYLPEVAFTSCQQRDSG